MEPWDDSRVDCYFLTGGLYLHTIVRLHRLCHHVHWALILKCILQDVPGADVPSILKRPCLDHPREPHVWLLLDLVPPLRRHASLRA